MCSSNSRRDVALRAQSRAAPPTLAWAWRVRTTRAADAGPGMGRTECETQGGPVRPPPPLAPHTNFTPNRTCPPLQGQTSSPAHESLKAKRFHSFSGRNHLPQEGTSPGFNNILLEARSYFRALLWWGIPGHKTTHKEIFLWVFSPFLLKSTS